LYILSLCIQMNKLGIEVDILARWHDPAEPEIINLNKRTRLIHIRGCEPAIFLRWIFIIACPSFQANLLAFMQRDGARYDIIRSHYWTSALVAERIKKQLEFPMSLLFHTLGEVERNRALGVAEEPEIRIQSEKEIVQKRPIVSSLLRGRGKVI